MSSDQAESILTTANPGPPAECPSSEERKDGDLPPPMEEDWWKGLVETLRENKKKLQERQDEEEQKFAERDTMSVRSLGPIPAEGSQERKEFESDYDFCPLPKGQEASSVDPMDSLKDPKDTNGHEPSDAIEPSCNDNTSEAAGELELSGHGVRPCQTFAQSPCD